MKKIVFVLILLVFIGGCAQNVWFDQIDESYEPSPNPAGKDIVFTTKDVNRPHHVIGIIQAELGKGATKGDLNRLLLQKANEIGADGLMSVEYDTSKERYIERHHHVVGHGRYKRHVVRETPRVDIDRTVSAIAVIFDE